MGGGRPTVRRPRNFAHRAVGSVAFRRFFANRLTITKLLWDCNLTYHNNDISSQWRIRSYVDSRGAVIAKDWLDGLRMKERAKVVSRLEFLAYQPRSNWRRPDFDQLKGQVKGLGEIRIRNLAGQETRLIGFFDEIRWTFVIVLIVTKKGHQYNPKSWEEVALSRVKEVRLDGSRASDWYP